MIQAKNMTIDKVSRYFASGDPNVLVPYIGKWFEDRFNRQFNELFEAKTQNLDDQITLLAIYNRGYNLLPCMHELIRLGLISSRRSLAKGLAAFEDYFGSSFVDINQLNRIKSEAERLQRKFKSMNIEQGEVERFNFEGYVIGVEMALSMNIPRSTRLFQFKEYADRAKKLMKKRKDG